MEREAQPEIDLPATIADEQQHLKDALGSIPASMHYVSIDFDSQRLEDRPAMSGFRSDQLAFFILEDVTM